MVSSVWVLLLPATTRRHPQEENMLEELPWTKRSPPLVLNLAHGGSDTGEVESNVARG